MQCRVGSSLSPRVLAWAWASGVYRLAKVTGGCVGRAGRPPAERPPISAPGHQTPERSGWPSGMRGILLADATPPEAAPAFSACAESGLAHIKQSTAPEIIAIVECIICLPAVCFPAAR